MRGPVTRAMARALCVPAVLAVGVAIAAQEPPLESLLRTVGDYISQYERDISAIVAEEDYLQVTEGRGMSTRRLRSDVLVMEAGEAGWVSFRDVFEVDGQPVRDREERLAKLFLEPQSGALAQLRRIAGESARFNLNPAGVGVSRTINTPMTALVFFRTAYQPRSEFSRGDARDVNGRPCVEVRFVEQTKPRVIASDDDAPARGSACVEPETGRVLQTEFVLRSTLIDERRREQEVAARIAVVYQDVPRLSLWLPATMDEFYDFRPGVAVIHGHAEYSAFRKFQVETDADIR